jgi:hypothetical protein
LKALLDYILRGGEKMDIDWKTIIIGIVIAIVLGWIFNFIMGGLGYLAYLLATIYVGYTVGGDWMNGAIHGALVGVVAALVFGIIAVIGLGAIFGAGAAALGILAILIAIIIDAIIGAIGGAIGVLVKGAA